MGSDAIHDCMPIVRFSDIVAPRIRENGGNSDLCKVKMIRPVEKPLLRVGVGLDDPVLLLRKVPHDIGNGISTISYQYDIPGFPIHLHPKIGRASCRERAESWEADVAVQEKEKQEKI